MNHLVEDCLPGIFSKNISKKYKVVVSGVGGDELLEIIIDHLIF